MPECEDRRAELGDVVVTGVHAAFRHARETGTGKRRVGVVKVRTHLHAPARQAGIDAGSPQLSDRCDLARNVPVEEVQDEEAGGFRAEPSGTGEAARPAQRVTRMERY